MKNGLKSSQFLADLINSAWRILADFHIRSGGFEKNHLATLAPFEIELHWPKHVLDQIMDL
jgi:hypothetical protein